MNAIIVTGATGFLGSALAAQCLNKGMQVIALSRNDDNGKRTGDAVAEAANGYKMEVDTDKLIVLDPADSELFTKISNLINNKVTDFFHCAAEMSYSWKGMGKSLNYNVSESLKLMKLSKKLELNSFNYISTLFTTHNPEMIKEEIHLDNQPVNAYQGSKWMAENHLYFMAKEWNMRLNIFRPGVIVGHSETGWTSGKPFGFYMFLKGFQTIKNRGISKVTVDLNKDTKAPLVNIDQVTDAILVTYRKIETDLNIIHVVNNDNSHTTIQNIGDSIGDIMDMDIQCGKPKTFIDQIFDKGVKLNKEFATTQWHYETNHLDKHMHSNRQISLDNLHTVVRYFCENPQKIKGKVPVKKKFKQLFQTANLFLKYKINRS